MPWMTGGGWVGGNLSQLVYLTTTHNFESDWRLILSLLLVALTCINGQFSQKILPGNLQLPIS